MSLSRLGMQGSALRRAVALVHGPQRMRVSSEVKSGSNPSDAFAAKLRSKTELELLELLERRNQQSAADQPQQDDCATAVVCIVAQD